MSAKNLLPRRAGERLVARAIQRSLDVSDLKPEWKRKHAAAGCDAMTGHCFTATNAFFHAMGGHDGPYVPLYVKHEGASHWFLLDKRDGFIVDLTASQFRTRPPYEQGKRAGMRANKGGDAVPTRAAERVLKRADALFR